MNMLLLSLMTFVGEVPDARIYSLPEARETAVARMAKELAQRDVVFLGEDHDNTAGHQMQLEILKALHQLRPDLVVSLEMFERDTQGLVDDYLRGRISEEDFLKDARPWRNYREHYRPIVEFAREAGLDVLAANVPRELASRIAKGQENSRADAIYLPRTTTAAHDAYWDRFVETMQGHGGVDEDTMDLYFRSQCLKDDAMAEAIVDYLDTHQHRRPLVVHLCGKFHSDYGLGTVQRFLSRRPLLLVGVVSMERTEPSEEVDLEELRDRAHFLITVPPDAEKDESSEDAEKAAGEEEKDG